LPAAARAAKLLVLLPLPLPLPLPRPLPLLPPPAFFAATAACFGAA